MNILLCVSGSVAAIKTWELIKALEEIGQVRTVFSERGEFFARRSIPENGGRLGVLLRDEDEWKWNALGDRILHIDLKDWADVLVIAPLSANTLAKVYGGFCDNLLTSIYRAWPMGKPVVLAPAMNTDMWEHPLTRNQLDEMSRRHFKSVKVQRIDICKVDYDVKSWMNVDYDIIGNAYVHQPWLHIVNPVEKNLACGVHGMGAMASVESIVEAVNIYNTSSEKSS